MLFVLVDGTSNAPIQAAKQAFSGKHFRPSCNHGKTVMALARYTFPPKKHRTFTTQFAHSFIV
jgi:hypothetical protein